LAYAAENKGIWANTAAKLANLMSNPWTIALAAVAIAAIAGMLIWISASTKSTNENTKAQLANAEAAAEQGKKAKEAADAWQKEADALNVLISSYEDLDAAGKDVV
jgi:uncharacterized membrane-anchored protein YhcB (DUF1043 family)